MPSVPVSLMEPVWSQFATLLPDHHTVNPTHPLGCHRRRISDRVAVDTLGQLLALHVTAANEQDRAQVAEMADAVQEATGETVEIAYVDQGYTGLYR